CTCNASSPRVRKASPGDLWCTCNASSPRVRKASPGDLWCTRNASSPRVRKARSPRVRKASPGALLRHSSRVVSCAFPHLRVGVAQSWQVAGSRVGVDSAQREIIFAGVLQLVDAAALVAEVAEGDCLRRTRLLAGGLDDAVGDD